jgi:mono/diheme cytochrome c family protein
LRTDTSRLATLRIALALVVIAVPASNARAQAKPVKRDTVPPALVAEGKKIFEGKSGGALCVTCHAITGKGVTGLGPDLTDAEWLHGDGSLSFIEQLIKTGVMKPKKSAAVMPPMGGAALKPDQLKAVAAYVYSIGKR